MRAASLDMEDAVQLSDLKELAQTLTRHMRHRHQVGVFEPLDHEGSILLRSQRRIEEQRNLIKKRKAAERAARKARLQRAKAANAAAEAAEAPDAAATPEAAPKAEPKAEAKKAKPKAEANKEKKLFVTRQVAQSEINLEVDSGLVADWLSEGRQVLFVDVREVPELLDGHLEGALLMPQGEVARRWQEIDTQQTTVVYCLSGAHSLAVANKLRSEGHGDAWSMTGGIGSWLAQGGQQLSPPVDAAHRLCDKLRLTEQAAERLGRPVAQGTLQEVRATDDGLRYTLGVPTEGGLERIDQLTDADLEPA
jgi:rhodanese-related sulfurtransferase